MTDAEQRAVADIVLAQLKPILTDILQRLPKDGELAAINEGVRVSLEMGATSAQRVDKFFETLKNHTDNFSAFAQEQKKHNIHVAEAIDKLGAFVHKRDERERQEHGETTLVEAERLASDRPRR